MTQPAGAIQQGVCFKLTGSMAHLLLKEKMHNWQENEIKELLSIRGSEGIRDLITGTVKDSVVYSRIAKLLAERGVHRTHMQVVSKLKSLRKQYLQHRAQKNRCGNDRVHWLFYELCHKAFGDSALPGNPLRQPRSPTPPPVMADQTPTPSPPSPLPAPPSASESNQEVVVSVWDEVDDQEITKHLGQVESEDMEERFSPPEQLHINNTSFSVPSKKRKTTVMQQVSALVSATVTQLREMDAAMQAQEDARLQRLMHHEREMQNNLMGQLIAMNERISRENHVRNLELVDRILSRFPSPSSSSGR